MKSANQAVDTTTAKRSALGLRVSLRRSMTRQRYIAFLDVLGFAETVRCIELDVLKQRLSTALQSVEVARRLGNFGSPNVPTLRPLHFFSFSDTFVFASDDDSLDSLFVFAVGSALLTQLLFAQGLPVRGAITFGEADFIPGTGHLVGKAIVHAHELERQQDWLGVVVDEVRLPKDAMLVFESPLISPLFVRWDVPLKESRQLQNALVVNWRLNLVTEKGIRSLFRHSDDPHARTKIENTLRFSKHLRDTGKAEVTVTDKEGKKIRVPWLSGCKVSERDPRDGLKNGDEY